MEKQQRSWRAMPTIVGGLLGAAAVALLLNITAGAIDPRKVPSILHWGWFGLAIYFPLYLIYVSPAWGWLANPWHRSVSKVGRVVLYSAIAIGYLVVANCGIVWAWRHLAPHQVALVPPLPPAGAPEPPPATKGTHQRPPSKTMASKDQLVLKFLEDEPYRIEQKPYTRYQVGVLNESDSLVDNVGVDIVNVTPRPRDPTFAATFPYPLFTSAGDQHVRIGSHDEALFSVAQSGLSFDGRIIVLESTEFQHVR